MHRSAFRVKPANRASSLPAEAPKSSSIPHDELKEIREQIGNLTRSISPLRASVESLAVPKDDISVPTDIAKSLKSLHSRLDKLEAQQERLAEQSARMASTFSNAILKLADKVEKIAGVEDSSFSLAHSLEKLLSVLSARKLKIIRDSNGDMAAVEITTGTQN